MSRTDWAPIVERAAGIVRSYDTSVTLRQLFYRLVAEQTLPNTTTAYKRLSDLTAKARRADEFPELIDRGRSIHRYEYWPDIDTALEEAKDYFRLDRTKGQDMSIYLGVEKAGMVVQLQSWFGDLGIPVVVLGGYSSQTYVDDVVYDTRTHDRGAVLLYGGDFDPSGEDIDRDFVERSGCWDKVVRVALTATQVREYSLPVNPGKSTDSRAAGFISRHGSLMQVELDALDPIMMQQLYADAISVYWDTSAYDDVLELERQQRESSRQGGAS
jgi:hypothetical protein